MCHFDLCLLIVSSHSSNTFSPETDWPVKAKIGVVGGTIVYSRHLSHMTKMATTPIYVKTLNIFSRTSELIFKILVCSILDSSHYIFCSNDGPRFTLTYFQTTRSGNILSFLLSLFQEGQLSVTGESMCTKYWLTA